MSVYDVDRGVGKREMEIKCGKERGEGEGISRFRKATSCPCLSLR